MKNFCDEGLPHLNCCWEQYMVCTFLRIFTKMNQQKNTTHLGRWGNSLSQNAIDTKINQANCDNCGSLQCKFPQQPQNDSPKKNHINLNVAKLHANETLNHTGP